MQIVKFLDVRNRNRTNRNGIELPSSNKNIRKNDIYDNATQTNKKHFDENWNESMRLQILNGIRLTEQALLNGPVDTIGNYTNR